MFFWPNMGKSEVEGILPNNRAIGTNAARPHFERKKFIRQQSPFIFIKLCAVWGKRVHPQGHMAFLSQYNIV